MEEINIENKRRFEQVIRDEFPKLIQMFNKTFDFKSWGFELTHTGIFPQYLPYIIYESRQCKLRFDHMSPQQFFCNTADCMLQ